MTNNISTPVSGKPAIDALLVGRQWGTNVGQSTSLTYSIPQGTAYWVNNYLGSEPDTWGALSQSESDAFRLALNTWSEVANIQFTEVADSQSYGEIRVAFSQAVTNDPNSAGWAYVPGWDIESGDIWLDNQSGGSYLPTSFGFTTFLHEIGHAIGLAHPFDANEINGATLTGEEDSSKYTLMSYNDHEGAGYTFIDIGNNDYSWYPVQALGPLLYDIQAIQYLYGKNTATRSGDDTYTFSNSTGEIKAIWDGGGNDTFDLSNQTLAMNINLNAGEFSSLGVKATWDNGIVLSNATDNIAIAYDVIIENAIGGQGNDNLIGNIYDNQLTGGQGDDSLAGGAGTDTAIYQGLFSEYQIQSQASNKLTITASSDEGTDTLTDIEWLQFQDQSINTNTFTNPIPTSVDEVVTAPNEGNENSFNYFLLSIETALLINASVNYKTIDGTANAGEDYLFTSGIATIEAGKTSTAIAIEIMADTLPENDESFYLEISNPIGALFPTGQNTIKVMHTIIDDDVFT